MGASASTAGLQAPLRLRPWLGWIVGTLGVVAVTVGLLPFDLATVVVPCLLLVLPVLGAALLGGRVVSVVVAVEAAFALATGFLPPIGSPAVEVAEDVVALVVFVAVALAVGSLVGTLVGADQRRWAAEARRVDALQLVDQQRSMLLRSVSHDLRTPLATIQAVTSDLRDGAPYDPATKAELLGLVEDEAARLDRIVANLLSLSRAESGNFAPASDPVDLGELVAACTSRLARVLKDTKVEVDIPIDLPAVAGDYSQLDQVLTNLLENVARHAHGTTVTIAAFDRGERVDLVVTDDGPGLTPDVQAGLFGPLGTRSAGSSSGMGLSIVGAIVDAHGGTITVESAPGDGTRFTISLPIGS